MTNHHHIVLSATSLVGDEVKNRDGENLGSIEELMLDTEHGRIAYAVLSFGGILGIGDKLFAIPWQALDLNTDEKCFYLNADKETLKAAPGFDKEDWPDMANNQWRSSVYNHYSIQPYWN